MTADPIWHHECRDCGYEYDQDYLQTFGDRDLSPVHVAYEVICPECNTITYCIVSYHEKTDEGVYHGAKVFDPAPVRGDLR